MDYAELHCHSHYSLLDGASSPRALAARAAELGLAALALTDHDGLYGAVRFDSACRDAGIYPVIGAEVTLADSTHLVLLARTQQGYHNLCRLLSTAHLAGTKRKPHLPIEALAGRVEGLVALSACARGGVPRLLLAGDHAGARALARRLAGIFGHEGFWIELQRHLLPGEDARQVELAGLARDLGLGLVATNNVHYATAVEADLQDALVCIRERCTVDDHHPARLPNAEYRLKSAQEMAALFPEYPEALANGVLLARRCGVSLDFSEARLPPFPIPDDRQPIDHLRDLCMAGLWHRYRPPSQAAIAQLAHELGVIERTKLAEYFLIVHDVVQFARRHGILCQGRGSAADSLAVYCLGITPVDPLAHNLLFDRFLNEGRASAPDIDLDIQNDRREEVIQYVYERYGEAHTSMVCNMVTFRPRSALRDLGRVLGFPPSLIDRLARGVESWSAAEARAAAERLMRAEGAPDAPATATHSGGQDQETPSLPPGGQDQETPPFMAGSGSCRAKPRDLSRPPRHEGRLNPAASRAARGHDPLPGINAGVSRVVGVSRAGGRGHDALEDGVSTADPSLQVGGPADQEAGTDRGHSYPQRWETLIRLAEAIDGCPRHLSIHVGGMIITARPLMELVPLERATMPGRVVVQWNKDDVEDAGLIKIDLLGLGMLALVAEAGNLIRAGGGEAPAQEDLPLDDVEVFAMLRRGDTIGCFQVESRAQEQMVHKHRPETFNDIVVQVAIIRPGPIVGNMVHPYLRRRQGLEPVRYLHSLLEPILQDTLGIILYQEQIIQIATDVAGFSPGEADRLRRAMTSSRSAEAMAALRAAFEAGCLRHGLAPEQAAALFTQISGFGQYGFCRSHAACFALLAYQSLWLKRYHPPEFYCALLNNQPMGFYSPAVVVGDARRHGVRILQIDSRYSGVRCAIEEEAIRLGYNYVRHIGAAALARLPLAIGAGPFTSVVDFWARTGLDTPAMTALVRIGAFDHFGTPRRQLLWQLPLLAEEVAALRGQRMLLREPDPPTDLEEPDDLERTEIEQEVLGLAVSGHPFRFIRPLLPNSVARAEALRFLPDGAVVTAAGFAVCRQRPGTARGFVFLTLEDETGMVNVIVRPDLYERQRALVRRPLAVVEGLLQREGRARTVLARRFLAVESLLVRPAHEGKILAFPERAVHNWR